MRRQPAGFVRIAAGTFTMGSPTGESGRDNDEGQHRVTITGDFFMQTHEVTQGEWRALMGNNPSNFSSCGNNCPDAFRIHQRLRSRHGVLVGSVL